MGVAATSGAMALAVVLSACAAPTKPTHNAATVPSPTSSAAPTTTTATSTPVTPHPPTTTTPTTTSGTTVGTTVLALVDRSRPTISRGRQLSALRTLTTTVWYPQGGGNHPLVVFAHGYRIGVGPYRRLCLALAQKGFVVAAPSFPLTDQSVAGTALDEGDTVNQPADLTFVITQVLAASASASGVLHGRVDAGSIAAVGHSDGADTVLALGYLPANKDQRVTAVVADAPDPLPRPAGPPLASTVPLLLIHGDHDTISPFSGSQRLVTQLRTKGWFLVLRGADHLPPIEGGSAWTPVLDRVTIDFLTGIFAGDPNLGQRLTADVQQSPAALTALP